MIPIYSPVIDGRTFKIEGDDNEYGSFLEYLSKTQPNILKKTICEQEVSAFSIEENVFNS